MSRRTFIRWIITLLLMIGVATTALVKLLQRAIDSQHTPAQAVTLQKPASVLEPDTVQSEYDPDAAQFSYMILSDLHISTEVPSTIKKLKDAIEDMKQFGTPVEAVVITGDLTEYGMEKEYQELHKILSAYPLPTVYANMGNHDYYDIWIDRKGAFNQATMPNGKTDWQSRERFQKFFGLQKPYHDDWVKGHHLIMLSQETYVQEKPEVGEGAWYSDEQLAWLEQQLAAHKDGKPVFIMTHQPLPPAGQDGRTHQLIRANKFRELVKPYKNVFVFCGHRHHDFQGTVEHYIQEGFHYFHNSSVGRVLNKSYQHVDKEKSQGLYVQVYKDRVTLRGREFSSRKWIKEADWTVKLV